MLLYIFQVFSNLCSYAIIYYNITIILEKEEMENIKLIIYLLNVIIPYNIDVYLIIVTV